MNKQTPIWEATLDDIYNCVVVKTGDYDGVLTIKKNNTRVFETGVKLTAGAIFGADVIDIAEWQSICVDYVDNRSK
jgi:hypothetical protein